MREKDAPQAQPKADAGQTILLNQSDWITTSQSVHHAALDLVQNAERTVFVLVSNFVQGQFDDPDVTAALSVFARSSRYAQLCILVSSTQKITATPHPLLQLQHRLSSLIQIRQVLPDQASDLDLMLVDQRHLLTLQLARSGLTAHRIQHAIPHAQQLSERFLAWWQTAQPILELRRLSL